MRTTTNGRLQNKLADFIAEIKRAIKEVRKDGEREDMHDYPAMAVGCEYDGILECGRSNKTHKRIKDRIPRAELNNRVVNKVRVVTGQVDIPCTYVDANGKRMFAGTCAEDDAASKVLNRIDAMRGGNPQLCDLAFTKAVRPRTGSKKTYCDVCKQVFS